MFSLSFSAPLSAFFTRRSSISGCGVCTLSRSLPRIAAVIHISRTASFSGCERLPTRLLNSQPNLDISLLDCCSPDAVAGARRRPITSDIAIFSAGTRY
ncbi:hypothetical protein B0H19DRAFT_1099162 [Mycena capillaripes]|nr:hypothetical protein B0H19DRAFT_1099162 [Mycena capillaripes]